MAILGAIRWDVGGYDVNPEDIAENNTLSNTEYHYRAPFYATIRAINSINITATQQTMDQEIAFAISGGLSYWAVLRYCVINPGNADAGLALYQSSSARGGLKWASIEQVGTFGTFASYPANIGRLITEMQQSHYQKVLSGRPLLYLYYGDSAVATHFGSIANLRIALDAIRGGAVTAGLPNPYIVLMPTSLTGADALRVSLGCDAISFYITTLPDELNATYASLRAKVVGFWAQMAAESPKIIPTLMTGWDQSPRIIRPVPWAREQKPRVGLGRVVSAATDAEMAAHIAEAVAYVAANPIACESEALLAYSWNEFGEGHRCLCPTLGNPTGTHLPLIAAAVS